MTLLLLLGRGAAFISENLWPAVALGFLAVVIAPAIWSRRRDRQRAAMAVIGVILQAVTTVVVTRRRSRHLWQDVFADLLTSEEQLRQQRARRWWLETCHLADLAGIPEVRVIALASMALQAGDDPGCGAETVVLAQAARSAAGDHASPTVLSVLAGREAIARMRSGIAALSEVVDADRMERSSGTASVCLMGRELQ